MSRNEQIAGHRERHVVLVAYYFPPLGGSGVQRVAKWAKYLPQYDWNVTVLTVEPGAYFAFDESLMNEVREAGIRVVRTRTLDPTRTGTGKREVKLPSERKRKLFSWVTGFFFLPDNKKGWLKHARKSFEEVQANGPVDVVLSSAPPYTSLLVGDELASHLGVSHVIDYRDDWVANPRHRYPTALHRRWHERAERSVVNRCARVITINESIRSLLLERHPDAEVQVFPQGFDPEDFRSGVRKATQEGGGPGGIREKHRVRLLYSGMFYDAQQPDSMLKAAALLKESDPHLADRLEMVFVGLFPEDKKALISALGLSDIVTLDGYKSHREAVADLEQSDILWMIVGHQQGGHMISTGKLFEYMGSRRPILALAPEGEVRRALSGYGAAWTVDPEDVGAIATKLAMLIKKSEAGTLPEGDVDWVGQFDRKQQTADLAALLEHIS